MTKFIKRIFILVILVLLLFGCGEIDTPDCEVCKECDVCEECNKAGIERIVNLKVNEEYNIEVKQTSEIEVLGQIEYANGVVKGTKSGAGVIHVQNKNIIDTYIFYVYDEVSLPVKLTISGDRIMRVGDELAFSTNLEGSTFTSSDEEVFTVTSDGIVTATGEGKAILKATNEGLADEIAITVTKDSEPIIIENQELLGIDQIEKYLFLFEDKNVGLITNQSGVNSDYTSSIDVLYKYTNLVALFAPEHGIRGNVNEGASIGDMVDSRTGITIHSLYGNTKQPTKAMLENVDVLCFDIQDVGARFYTYIYTMAYGMMAAKQNNIEFVVFDRPNPINGETVEGNILDMDYSSFIGMYPLVQRHGMTVGELAEMFNTEFGIGCNLTVVKMKNYDRAKYLDETSFPWVNPSPNIPQVETAVIYPGTCIFEGTNVSVARGTTKPFQWIGAPYIDGEALADALNALGLSSVYFRPVWFTPLSSTNANQLCSGVEVHVTNRETFESVYTGWAMFYVIRHMYSSDFTMNRSTINVNTGCNYISGDKYNLEELKLILDADAITFKETRAKYLLY